MTENQANTPPTVRYVHQGEDGGPRFTAAYVRFEHTVFFAWSSVYHTDRFVKSIGREVSLARLDGLFEQDLTDIVGATSFNPRDCVGVIDWYDVQDKLSSVIADHLLEGMDFHDLKHSYISSIIRNTVNSVILGEFE